MEGEGCDGCAKQKPPLGRLFALYNVRCDFVLIFFLALFDDLHCLVFIEESFDDTRSRFLEIFVVFPVVCRLLDELFSQVGETCDMFASFVICKNADYFVVNFAAVFEFHDTDNANFCERAGNEPFGYVRDHHIERIAIVIVRHRNRAIGEWVRERRVADAIEFEVSRFVNEFVFVDGALVDLDDCIDETLFFIRERGKRMHEVRHELLRFDIDVGH